MGYTDKNIAKEYRQKYYERNKDKIKKRASEWNKKNKERVAENRKRFFERHPEYANYWKKNSA